MKKVINVPPLKKVTFYAPVKVSKGDDCSSNNRKVLRSRTYQDGGSTNLDQREMSDAPQRVLISRSKAHNNIKVSESGKFRSRSQEMTRTASRRDNHKKVIAGGKQIKTILRCDHIKEGPVWGASSAKRNLDQQEQEETDLEIKRRRIDKKINKLLQKSPPRNSLQANRTRKVVSDGKQLKTVLIEDVAGKDHLNRKHLPRSINYDNDTDSSCSFNQKPQRRSDRRQGSCDNAAHKNPINNKKIAFDKSCKFCIGPMGGLDSQSRKHPEESSDSYSCSPSPVKSSAMIEGCPFCNKYTYQSSVRNFKECCHCCVTKSCARQSENIPRLRNSSNNPVQSNEFYSERMSANARRRSLRSYLPGSKNCSTGSTPRQSPSCLECAHGHHVKNSHLNKGHQRERLYFDEHEEGRSNRQDFNEGRSNRQDFNEGRSNRQDFNEGRIRHRSYPKKITSCSNQQPDILKSKSFREFKSGGLTNMTKTSYNSNYDFKVLRETNRIKRDCKHSMALSDHL